MSWTALRLKLKTAENMANDLNSCRSILIKISTILNMDSWWSQSSFNYGKIIIDSSYANELPRFIEENGIAISKDYFKINFLFNNFEWDFDVDW